MAVKSGDLVPNFLLKSETRGERDQHHHHAYGNSGDRYFYYRGRNTTFIFFRADEALYYEVFEIQIYMINRLLKSTFLFFLIGILSCANTNKHPNNEPENAAETPSEKIC